MDREGALCPLLSSSGQIFPQMGIPSQMDDVGTSINDWTPQMGMEFNDVEEAWEFWKIYAWKIGFGVRRRGSNIGKDGAITSARFCCAQEGHRGKDKRLKLVKKPRPETRMDCHARMYIKLVRGSGKYSVYDFEPNHSHSLHFAECAHLIRSHRQISHVQAQQIGLVDNAGLIQKQQHDLSSVQFGGRENVSYTRVDMKNYLCTKRGRDMEFGDAGCLLRYFEKRQILDTSFFYAVQLDSNEQITNIFWADFRMIIDYAFFGDVVTFDTTFFTNKEYRPLGVFIGLNHHKELVIFGAALLYDETADSFRWLFETFLGAHKNRRPVTIFTDQDAAMSKALEEVIPETRHGLCTWHLMQNATKNVGHLTKDGSNFLTDLKKLVYEDVDVEKFEEAWDSLLSSYQATDNSWLQNLYKLKEKWARCFMKSIVTLGIRSTQLSESLNGDLKDYLACNINLNGFFKGFDKVVNDMRYKEVRAEFNTREKLPTILCQTSPMLQQASKVYTPSMFENFQIEWMKTLGLVVKECNEVGLLREYVVSSFGTNDPYYKVTGGPSNEVVNCSCNHFETVGILCCHALKVLDMVNIKLIPSAYILKRWTREARNGILEKHGLDTQGNGDMDATDRYREVCPEFVKIAVKGSQTIQRYEFIKNMILTINKSLDEMPLGDQSQINLTGLSEDTSLVAKCTGLEKKDACKGEKRHKSCLEKYKTKRKKQGDAPQASSQASCAPQVLGNPPAFYSNLLSRLDAPRGLNMLSRIASLGDERMSLAMLPHQLPPSLEDAAPPKVPPFLKDATISVIGSRTESKLEGISGDSSYHAR